MASKKLKSIPALWWVPVLLLLAVLVYCYAAYYPFSPTQLKGALGIRSAQQQQASDFNSAHLGLIFNYTNPDFGYTISYPVGFNAQLDPEPGVDVRFIADNPGSSSEVIDVAANNDSSFTAQDFLDLQANLSIEGNVTYANTQTINGNPAYVVGATMVNGITNETMVIRQAIILCPVPQGNPGAGNFYLTITTVLPETLVADIPLSQFMMNSVTC